MPLRPNYYIWRNKPLEWSISHQLFNICFSVWGVLSLVFYIYVEQNDTVMQKVCIFGCQDVIILLS